ncbi:hypothetical protein SUGI_0091820 [Cryptomeria japonica]|nr:hypothetical protein SUGI_0091820 [Cryptomeria japonica]
MDRSRPPPVHGLRSNAGPKFSRFVRSSPIIPSWGAEVERFGSGFRFQNSFPKTQRRWSFPQIGQKSLNDFSSWARRVATGVNIIPLQPQGNFWHYRKSIGDNGGFFAGEQGFFQGSKNKAEGLNQSSSDGYPN